MRFLRLTRESDGSLVLVNPSQIKAVMKYFGEEDVTIVALTGSYDGDLEVKESVESIEKMLLTFGWKQ